MHIEKPAVARRQKMGIAFPSPTLSGSHPGLVLPAMSWGQSITTIAGRDISDSIHYNLHNPTGMAIDQSGVAYVADTAAHRLLKIATSGTTSILAGIGSPDFSGDPIPAKPS